MTHAIKTSFRSWREGLHLNQTTAARLLGRSRRQVYAYDTGSDEVPQVVQLAMLALEDHPELLKFADGSEAPDDEILHNPKVDDNYSPESQARMDELKKRLAKVVAEAQK